MPKIVQYVAPNANLTESTRGTAAFEQAGRRLGPLFNEAGTYQKEAGAAQAQQLKDQVWPFDIAKLIAAQGQGGVRLRTSGGGGGGTGRSRIGLPDNSSDAVTQISRGAGALGRALGDGGYTVASAKTPENYTLENGEIVTDTQSQKMFKAYNSALDKDVTDWTNQLVNTRDYWTKYYGGVPTDTNQAGFSDQPPAPSGDFAARGTSLSNAPDDSGGFWSGLVNSIGPSSTSDFPQE